MPPKRRVLLIGWDAADWRVITPLVDGGHMPHLRSLIESGCCGRISTLEPPLSPMLWTSIATGKHAWKHGIHGFSEVDPDTRTIRPISSLSRKCKAIWNILHQRGLRSHVIGWWPSHPVEPIRGCMVSNHFPVARNNLDEPWPVQKHSIHPKEIIPLLSSDRIHPEAIEGDMLRFFVPEAPQIDQEKDKRLYTIAKILATASTIQSAALRSMQQQPDWDLCAVYFDAIDHFCHGFMRYHPPKLDWVPEEDFQLYKDVVKAAYCFHDLLLGKLLQQTNTETTIILLSDHGFHPDEMRPQTLPNEPAGPASEHGRFGIFVAKGPGIREDASVAGATLLDVTPTLLNLFNLPIGRDMDGRVLNGIFKDPPQINYIDSWEDAKGEDGRHPPELRLYADSPEDSLTALQQLEELGYIEEIPDSDRLAAESTQRELQYNLARSLQQSGQSAHAREIYSELWNRWPEESRFGVHLLHSLIENHLPIEARETLEKLKVRKKQAAQNAVAALNEKLQADPDSPQSVEEIIRSLPEKERRTVRRLSNRAKTNPAAFAYLEGSVLFLEGHPEEALKKLEFASNTQSSQRTSALLKIAQIHAARRNWPNVLPPLQEVLKISPETPAAHFLLSRAHLAQKSWESAIEHATAVLQIEPHRPAASLILALAFWNKGDLEKTQSHLERTIQIDPLYPPGHFFMARFARLHQGDFVLNTKHRKLYLRSTRIRRTSQTGHQLDSLHPQERGPLLTSSPIPPLFISKSQTRFAQGEFLTIVSGLPRSGTSLLMQMLQAGGFPVLTDHHRKADSHNPKGYLEFEKTKILHRDKTWLCEAQGKALKLVAPLIGFLPPPQSALPYRVLFVGRPVEEIALSQKKMLASLRENPSQLSPEKARKLLNQQLVRSFALFRSWDSTSSFRFLYLDFPSIIQNPVAAASEIHEFLGYPRIFDPQKAAAAVVPSLHRNIAGSRI